MINDLLLLELVYCKHLVILASDKGDNESIEDLVEQLKCTKRAIQTEIERLQLVGESKQAMIDITAKGRL